MNHPHLILILLLAIGLGGCDKVKETARGAMGTFNKGVKERLDGGEPETDQALSSLVDQTDEGLLFRKDLPFPSHLRVISRVERKMSGRVIQTTETGQRKVQEVDGTETIVTELVRNKQQVTYTIKESGFALPGSEQQETTITNPFHRQAALKESLTFVRGANGWQTGQKGDFRAMALTQDLAPVFEELLEEHALMPRPLWFSKRRIRPGDEIEVSGQVLPLLLAGDADGRLTLRLEEVDAVYGHPCGRFKMSGEYRRRGVPAFDGSKTDEEVAIESGRIWLSLIHPVILKQEWVAIQTFHPSEAGGPGGSGQGKIELSVEREWREIAE